MDHPVPDPDEVVLVEPGARPVHRVPGQRERGVLVRAVDVLVVLPCATLVPPVRLTADPGLRVSGVVVDESGAPVRGATVQAAAESQWYQPQETDAAGRFALGALREGTKLQLQVSAGGFANATVRGVVAGSDDVRIVLKKGLSVSGRLVNAAGDPVAWDFFSIGAGRVLPVRPHTAPGLLDRAMDAGEMLRL